MASLTAIDGNEAAASVAYRLSEVIAIYPITPASAMAESCDAWSASERPNLWGAVPQVVELQSEGGAAGTLHGALLRGALGTTFTASQGLLLMLPNMFKIAGELTPTVIHVAARAVATHALSIFGDHSDVMAARTTGFAMLSAGSVQEAADMALIAHAATLESRVPFLHFFDGFRTSHEVNTIELPDDGVLNALIDERWIHEHRRRMLDPDRPVLRGTAQNPDVFFQAREAGNRFTDAVPGIVEGAMVRLGERTGRSYGLVDYHGAPDADRVVVIMGSGAAAVQQAVDFLRAGGERVGVLRVRLYRPFPTEALLAALPDSVRSVAVLDRTKEPGASGDPLYLDVVATLATASADGRPMPRIVGGRYGLSSKEFTPAMAKAVFDQLRADPPKRQFTVGIVDDVTHHSLSVDDSFRTDNARLRAVFYGLGADGTVSANKSSVKLVAQHAGLRAQGYFVYDSKKSGSTTTSHLRFDPERIDSPYLIADADFVGVHQFGLFDQIDMLAVARPGATLLINSPYDDARTWAELPDDVKDAIVDKNLSVSVIDAHRVAREAGLSGQINTVMQVCFFALVDLLPMVDALEAVKASVRRSYGKRGGPVVAANITAIDATLVALRSLTIPSLAVDPRPRRLSVPAQAPDFVQRVTAMMLAGRGDLLPVSAMPVDGVFPTGTAQYEKRRLASELPIWDSSICIDCARCALVCPHAAIRMKVLPEAELVPEVLATKPFRSKDHAGLRLTIQVSPEDCTGCGVCVDMCPARDKTSTRHKALDMEPFADHVAVEMARWEVFQEIVGVPDGLLDPATPKGSQARRPMFEFSGACAGCGETPYLKLLTQLYGDHLIVANATGCSSIYGGNLPTTPWTSGPEGRGPAWANSLFEDNAEFGLGMRIALDGQADAARSMLTELMPSLDLALVTAILALDPHDRWSDAEFAEQRARIAKLDADLAALSSEQGSLGATARRLASITSALVRRSVWIVGGDGWAYDIGSAGLDHVLASGRNVNILVLDTEVYSNTGGQASKSSPRGAVAKFAAAGKATAKKDLGAEAVRYGGVYVAQIAIGANDTQAVKAFAEAEAWPGPSLIIAYSTCIAHGIDMSRSMSHQRDAVKSGYWPLYRFRPGGDEHAHPFQLDSNAPSMPVAEFVASEGRFAQLERSDPERSRLLLGLAQRDVDERWRYYQQLAGVERTDPELGGPDAV